LLSENQPSKFIKGALLAGKMIVFPMGQKFSDIEAHRVYTTREQDVGLI
jgi:hypothetical protein